MMLYILLLFVLESSCLDDSSFRDLFPEDVTVTTNSGNTETPRSNYTHFGCYYKNSHYYMDTEWTAFWPNDPIFSEPNEEKLIFHNEAQFKEFYKKVDDIVQDELQSKTFNNIQPFLSMYDVYIKYANVTKEASFSTFFKKFIPKYPLKSGDDDIGALVRIYKKILTEDPRVQDTFVMGTKDKDVPQWQVDFYSYTTEKSREYDPPKDFQHDGVVGIINFRVAPGRTGFILIDTMDPKYPTPIVMEDTSDKLSRDLVHYYNIDDRKADSKIEGYLDYVSIQYFENLYKAPKTIDEKEQIKNTVESRDIIYKYKSLCSFLQTVEKAQFLLPKRSIFKLNKDGGYRAYIVASTLNDKISVGCRTKKSDDILECARMEFGLDEATLREILRRLREAMNNISFRKSLIKLQKMVFTPLYSKSSLRRFRDLATINFWW